MMLIAVMFYVVVVVMFAVIAGADIERGDQLGAVFAMLFAVFWPIALVVVISAACAHRE